MPQFVKDIIGSVVRHALQGVIIWLVAKGWITEDQGSELILAIIAGVVLLAWSIWQKYGGNLKFFTALEATSTSAEVVQEKIAERPAGANVAKAFSG